MPRVFYRLSTFLWLVLISSTPALAGHAEEDWAKVIALDAGPQTQSRNGEEARAAALAHLDRQEQALRYFVSLHATDGNAFEARLRLARLLQIRGDVGGSRKPVEEAARILDLLEKTAAPEQRVEVDFARITLLMRTLRADSSGQRERLLAAARGFQKMHPDDRRVAALLAEVATLFPLQPKIMRDLLTDAAGLARDAELKQRLADDLKRLDCSVSRCPLRFISAEGKSFDLEEARGSVVVVVFFALWSQPSLIALENIRRVVNEMPKRGLRIVGLSLDAKAEPLIAMLKEKGIAMPVGYDGKGWESPLVRSFGINSLPTVWLIDKQGRLRSLNGMEETASQLRQLVDER